MNKLIFFAFYICIVVMLPACKDNSINDTFVPINNQHWTYAQPIKTAFEVQDITKKYQVSINLRHTNEYKYANIWFRLIKIDPDKKKTVERLQFILANNDGAWLGTSSGGLFTYQLPCEESFTFTKPGIYHYIIEQNMRDNPLVGITDVGLRIEKNP